MSVINEGHGVTFTFAGLTLAPVAMELPGWVKEMIDLTNLNNTSVKTQMAAVLKKINDFKMRVEFDAAEIDGLPETNQTFIFTFPNSGGTVTVWCQITSVDNVPLENGARPLYDLTFGVTNLNGSNVETPPVYAA